jgi:hypothetical protein
MDDLSRVGLSDLIILVVAGGLFENSPSALLGCQFRREECFCTFGFVKAEGMA